MGRKISVLFFGTPTAHSKVMQHVLLNMGMKVSVRMPHATKNLDHADADHDVIAFDVSGMRGKDGGCLMLLRGHAANDGRWARACVTDVARLPGAMAELLQDAPGDDADTLRDLIDGLPGAIFRCRMAPDGVVDFVSDRIAALCGYEKWQLTGRCSRRLLALVHPNDRRRVLAVLQRASRDGRPFGIEHRIICAAGEEKWLWHHGSVRKGRDGDELESFVVDITDRKYEEQQLAYLASHDTLTGVANRGNFVEQLSKSLRRAERNGECVACLFLDLDRFKQVNDSFGHGFGDELLRQASQRLRRCVRGNDVIGRFGGDEFTVLLDGIGEPGDAFAAARKILEELSRPYVIGGHRLNLSASIGISCFPNDASDASALLRNADAAMYAVKSSGRCGCRFYSGQMSEKAYETLALTNGLRGAIESGQIQFCYQPRVNLRSGRVAGVEVLSRWHSAEFGHVPPERFVALAENVGLTGKLGEHVLRQACRQVAAWEAQALPATRAAVNVSPRQFRDEHLAEQVEDILGETGLAPERLELEISESTMMQDRESAAEVLRRLKCTGVKLSVDDFGKGYSSLQLLKEFPLDFLKVHGSFIRGVPDNQDDVAITEAIIAMAKRLDLGVVAQGIETEAQAIFVRSSGCDEGQGFLFCQPVGEPEVRHYLGRQVQ